MELLATHEVRHGQSLKRLCLYQGDLSAMPPAEAVDLLVVSAFPDDYVPTSRSLIGALHRRGLSVAALALDKEADLRTAFSSWLSRDLSRAHPNAGFRRLLCFENRDFESATEAVAGIFRAMLPFALGEPPIASVAMPLLATGHQRHDPVVMLAAIFDAAVHWLAAGLPAHTIKVVVHDPRHVAPVLARFRELSGQAAASRTSGGGAFSYDLFISYSHQDVAEADFLVERLVASAPTLRVFQDKLELDHGESWQTRLDEALESCRHVVPVYSPAYLASKMCIEEFNMARVRHRESPTPVLRPVFLRSAELPLYMRTLQYIDCREADRERLSRAALQLAAKPGS